jgi:hypothetical protein
MTFRCNYLGEKVKGTARNGKDMYSNLPLAKPVVTLKII